MAIRALRITLFIRQNCALCTDAKHVLSKVWDQRPFEYKEIDVMTPENYKTWQLYEFDTPVIHVEKSARPSTTAEVKKLMHRFKEAEVMQLMDETEKP